MHSQRKRHRTIHRRRKIHISKNVKYCFTILGVLIGPFVLGVLAFNFIALPLWVGKHEEIEIPDVCGKPLEEAQKELARVGLRERVQAQEFSKMPRGMVISQFPLPGRRVKPGKEIKLSVSRGVEKIKVPWLEGTPLTQAQNILSNMGLRVGEIIYEYSNKIPANCVIKTDPPVDKNISLTIRINIFVSQGGLEFPIPDFTGKTLRNAREEAYKLGLDLDVRYIAQPSPDGIIISQSPLPEAIGKSGTRVDIIVGLPKQ